MPKAPLWGVVQSLQAKPPQLNESNVERFQMRKKFRTFKLVSFFGYSKISRIFFVIKGVFYVKLRESFVRETVFFSLYSRNQLLKQKEEVYFQWIAEQRVVSWYCRLIIAKFLAAPSDPLLSQNTDSLISRSKSTDQNTEVQRPRPRYRGL